MQQQREAGKTKFGLPIDNSFSKAATEEAIQRAAGALRKNNFVVELVDTHEDARRFVNAILPKGQRVFTAASETLRLSKIEDDVTNSSDVKPVRQEIAKLDQKTQMPEIKRQMATPDVVVGSVHALTEDGKLIAASASGSQLGIYSSGAGKAISVVGSQKIVPDLETGLRRIQYYAYPKEDVRAREKYGMASFLAKILIMNMDWPAGRSTVVIVREPIGF